VPLNCGALGEGLAESTLFGHKRGAFTDARESRVGAIERAARGTLFLDEIAELPLPQQAKLLHVFDGESFSPLGDTREIRLQAVVVAATHQDLDVLVAQRRFREDLYHRLAVHIIRVPALAERLEDMRELMDRFSTKRGRRLQFTDAALRELARWPWPGNVRQLDLFMERHVTWAERDLVDVQDLTEQPGNPSVMHPPLQLPPRPTENIRPIGSGSGARLSYAELLDQFNRITISDALRETRGNQSAAARLLGISRKMVMRVARRHGL
jgi:DNA-binding NtrC family response regulator